MGTTQPIRDKEELKKFISYDRDTKPRPRDYALIVTGLHTALRISDILNLKWGDLYRFEKNAYEKHLCVQEKKTGKNSLIAVNGHVVAALEYYRATRTPKPADYIFSKNSNPAVPLCRSQAYRIIKKAASETLKDKNISCHSLRKTFGYHAWQQGISPVILMDIYNHSSYHITKRYLGIVQDERDSAFLKIDI